MTPGEVPGELVTRLPGFLARQRWFASDEGQAEPEVQVEDAAELARVGGRRLLWTVCRAGDARYQILIGERPNGEPADWLGGHEAAVLGTSGDAYYYDATLDPVLALELLRLVTDGAEEATRVRPIGAEQSNTSLVYDDRLILKLFRRLLDGPNPDVEVTEALAGAGFKSVASPLAAWRRHGTDLAFVQQFLAGGSEGWALALTSLRDLFGVGPDDPAEAGGDFAAEAERLGRMTAEMHLAMAAAFGTEADPDRAARWAAGIAGSLGNLAGEDPAVLRGAERVVEHLAHASNPGPAIRVHGDYHLGQVMRTGAGWYVLDFEGEPARPLAQRLAHTSALKDVTGMLRSLSYASRFALTEREDRELEHLEPLAEAWERRNRDAFLAGYLGFEGIDGLLPRQGADRTAVLAAFELDKALYELAYERAYRPAWVDIPRRALRRLTTG